MPTTEPIDEEYIEIPVTLKLKKNIAELLRIHSICYSEYPSLNSEMIPKFVSREISKICISLAESPPFPEDLPEMFKQMLKNILNESPTNTNDNLGDLK